MKVRKARKKMKARKARKKIKTSKALKKPVKSVLEFIFSNAAGLHLQSLLRNKHFLRYIFKTPILITPFFPEKHVVPTKMVWLKGGGF